MSLIMSFETYEGIVMTADRMATVSFYNENFKTTESFCKTKNAHKIFVMKNGYGISFCDASSFNNNLLEEYVTNQICLYDFDDLSPGFIGNQILHMLKKQYNGAKIISIMCGYYNNNSFTIEIDTSKEKIYKYPDSSKNKVVRYGETDIANAVLDEKFYYGYSTYRLQDGIELLKFTNFVSAKYQEFQENLQTISEDCDILILKPDRTYEWLSKKTLHV